jgi:hypothetical protein
MSEVEGELLPLETPEFEGELLWLKSSLTYIYLTQRFSGFKGDYFSEYILLCLDAL